MKLVLKQRLFSWFDSYDVCDFLYTAVFSDKAQEFLRKRAGEATPKNYPCTQGRTYTP